MAVVSGVLVLLLAKKKNECKSKKGLRSFVTSKTKEAGGGAGEWAFGVLGQWRSGKRGVTKEEGRRKAERSGYGCMG